MTFMVIIGHVVRILANGSADKAEAVSNNLTVAIYQYLHTGQVKLKILKYVLKIHFPPNI